MSRIIRLLSIACFAFAVAVMLATPTLAQNNGKGKGGGGGPGGGTAAQYVLIDLLGFDNGNLGYQSVAEFVTNRNSNGALLVHGYSYQRFPTQFGFTAHRSPATWSVDANGNFPEPFDLTEPEFPHEFRSGGFNQFGIAVGSSNSASNPGYANIPGIGYVELPALTTRSAFPRSINDAGIIVGGIAYGFVMWQLYLDGSVSEPVSLGDFNVEAINNHGVMAGTVQGYMSIAWFQNGSLQIQSYTASPRSLGPLNIALNDCDIADSRLAIVATSRRNEAGVLQVAEDSTRATVWSPNNPNNEFQVLGTLGGQASYVRDVNVAGKIVGFSTTKKDGHHAFVYDGNTMIDLNTITTLGSQTLNQALGINEDGDIVGFMRIPRPVSEDRGFLLRPIPAN